MRNLDNKAIRNEREEAIKKACALVGVPFGTPLKELEAEMIRQCQDRRGDGLIFQWASDNGISPIPLFAALGGGFGFGPEYGNWETGIIPADMQ